MRPTSNKAIASFGQSKLTRDWRSFLQVSPAGVNCNGATGPVGRSFAVLSPTLCRQFRAATIMSFDNDRGRIAASSRCALRRPIAAPLRYAANGEANGLADGAAMLDFAVLPKGSCWLRLSCRQLDAESRSEAGLLDQRLPFGTVGLPPGTEQFVDRQVGPSGPVRGREPQGADPGTTASARRDSAFSRMSLAFGNDLAKDLRSRALSSIRAPPARAGTPQSIAHLLACALHRGM